MARQQPADFARKRTGEDNRTMGNWKKRGNMTLGTMLRTLLPCALLAAVPAYAMPFSVAAPASAEQGDWITVSLLFDGSTAGLEGALLRLTFDGSVFDYQSPPLGSVGLVGSVSPVSLGVGKLERSELGGSLEQVDFSWATTLGPAGKGSLVDLEFLIKAGAPFGSSEIVFQSLLASDYDIPRTSGTVRVMAKQGTRIPEPGAAMLFGLGIVTLLACRRRLATRRRANVFFNVPQSGRKEANHEQS